MQISKMLLDNFTTIALVVGLGIIIMANKNFDKRINSLFAVFVLIILMLVVSGMIDYLNSFEHGVRWVRYLAASFGYTLRPAAVVLLITILQRRRKTCLALWIPIGCIAVIAFTSWFTHLMFWFTERNVFMRGPLSFISHLCSLLYVVVLLALTLMRHRYLTSGEIFAVIFSLIVSVVATLLETILSDNLFLITGAMAVSCVLYYIILYAETFKVDQLTGLLNRRSLYQFVSSNKNRRLSVISLDLNSLKKINDSEGHRAGDDALKRLATVLVDKSGPDYCAYRVGGDEFIIIGKEIHEEEIKLFIDELRGGLKKEKLSASFGYAVLNSGDSFDEICNKADEQMYEDKRRYKARPAVD